MIRSILMLALIVIIQHSFAQDSAINKMRQMDRNRVTDTVHVSGSNDKMNVYVPPTTDSLQSSAPKNSIKNDSNSVAPPPEAKSINENVWVSRGLWLALLAILIIIVVRRRRNAGK